MLGKACGNSSITTFHSPGFPSPLTMLWKPAGVSPALSSLKSKTFSAPRLYPASSSITAQILSARIALTLTNLHVQRHCPDLIVDTLSRIETRLHRIRPCLTQSCSVAVLEGQHLTKTAFSRVR